MYPPQQLLMDMADADLAAWDDGNDTRPLYRIPGPEQLRTLCANECSIIHIDTTISSIRRGRPMVTYLNQDFDHLRLLWFGCSFQRIADMLHRRGIEINSYFVINIGDGYIIDERANFPIWSKARMRPSKSKQHVDLSEGGDDTSNFSLPKPRAPLDVMMPYEELLWSYPDKDLFIPFEQKKKAVAYRGGCTNPRREPMCDAVRRAFPPPASDVAVSCKGSGDFLPLSAYEQSEYRCLLDYDGFGYSRRMAWYMETGSVILRGGDVDDILSRLARIKDDGTGPVLFWEWGSEEAQPSKPTNSTKSNEESKPNGLISSVRKCLQNDTYARDVSEEAVQFWSEYVERGQEVWDGYMAYLFVKQSLRFEMTLKEEEFTSFAVPPLFQSLSKSKMVCSVVSDIATPTGENGRPRWKYIRAGTAYLLITFCSSFVALSAILRKLRTSSSAHSHIY